jgi:hypothetical protein
MANNNQKSGSGGSIAIVILIIIVLLYALGSCSGGSSSSSSGSAKCQVCGKTFTNSSDRKSIAYTNMCERCYSNYKYSQDMKEGLKKYQENYGN